MNRVLQLQTVGGLDDLAPDQHWSTISGGDCGGKSWSSFSSEHCSNVNAMFH